MSNNSASKGKAPISEKKVAEESVDQSFMAYEAIEDDFFAIEPNLQKELDRKGYIGRWINAKTYQKNYGYHRSGWKVYKRDAQDEVKGSLDFNLGTDPEGYVRRGDLVLAVKPKVLQERHKAKIAAKNAAHKKFTQQSRQDLEETARRGGLRDVQILDGYDENS